MRCGDCNKFVSVESDQEPEVDNIDVDDDGNVTGSVRIVNTCGECGTELKEANIDIEQDFSTVIQEHRDAEGHKDIDHDTLDVDTGDLSRYDEYGKGRRGAHFYGAEVAIIVTCKCGETFTETWRDRVQASEMEDC